MRNSSDQDISALPARLGRRMTTSEGVLRTPTLANGKICYIEIPATDVARSSEFYKLVFTWNTRKPSDGGTFDDTLHRGELEEKRRRLGLRYWRHRESEKGDSPWQAGRKGHTKGESWRRLPIQEIADFKRKYFTDEAWVRFTELRDHSPESRDEIRKACEALYRDVGDALGEDPESRTAQALATRWMSLCTAPAAMIQTSKRVIRKVWGGRQNWPASGQKRIASFKLNKCLSSLAEPSSCRRKTYLTKEVWAKLAASWRESNPESRVQNLLGMDGALS
jgi:hypothetical protein